MNKNRLKQLTFGFEIEGLFDNSLSDLPGKFKEDGSVHTEDMDTPNKFTPLTINVSENGEDCEDCNGTGHYGSDCECEHSELNCEDLEHTRTTHTDDCWVRPCDLNEDYHYTDCDNCSGSGRINCEEQAAPEYASPIYQDFDKMLKDLSTFKSGNNHIHNDTCGLHLHIGLKNNHWKKLYNAVGELDFLTHIQIAAPKWCECLKDRLLYQNNLYYQFWKNPKDLIDTFNGKQPERNFNGDSLKYRFMRFHKQFKTLEFRFLSPCEHKCANIENLVSMLTDYLGEETNLVVESMGKIQAPQKTELNIDLKAILQSNQQLSNTLPGFIDLNTDLNIMVEEYLNNAEIIERTN